MMRLPRSTTPVTVPVPTLPSLPRDHDWKPLPDHRVDMGNEIVTASAVYLSSYAVVAHRGQGHDQVAQSRAYQLQADPAILQRQLHADVDGLKTALRSHHQSASELARLNVDEQSSLSYLAEISYQAGELTVMELLDAYQSDLATAQRLIEVSLQARLSYIQLQQLHGE